jgi:hypothetical protein
MRNAFRNHYIYTCAVGLLAFAWIFTRPPLDLSQPVPQPTATAAKADPTGQGVGKRGDQVTVVQPVTATSIINKTAPAPVEADDTISTAAIGQLAAPAARLLRVDADNLRMRSGPSSSTEPLGTYQRGTVLEELESQGQWSLVRNVETGTIGWMFADYLASAE